MPCAERDGAPTAGWMKRASLVTLSITEAKTYVSRAPVSTMTVKSSPLVISGKSD